MPIMCLVVATGEHMFLSSDIPELSAPVMKAMQLYSDIHTIRNTGKSVPFATEIDWPLIYIVLSLTTTLICTLLILYRIVHFARRLLPFRRIISALIESAIIYTLSLIVYLALVGRNMMAANYADIVAAYIRVKTSLDENLFSGLLFPHHMTGNCSDTPGTTCGSWVDIHL